MKISEALVIDRKNDKFPKPNIIIEYVKYLEEEAKHFKIQNTLGKKKLFEKDKMIAKLREENINKDDKIHNLKYKLHRRNVDLSEYGEK